MRETDRLLREAHEWVQAAGVSVSVSRVNRTVKKWLHGQPDCTFGAFLSRSLPLNGEQVREINARYVRAYRDPTGDTAVANVMRSIQ